MKQFRFTSILVILITVISCSKTKDVEIITSGTSSERVIFGIEKLGAALAGAGYNVTYNKGEKTDDDRISIFVGETGDVNFKKLTEDSDYGQNNPEHKEGFSIVSRERSLIITGYDGSGALYGCIELAQGIRDEGRIPEKINLSDNPEMVMRGTCVGLQKTVYLPGRRIYEYPYTPENFPWFYDKESWIKYLDMMVENRFNTLYLWNGHPFASLVKLEDYPYAVEVDDETFKMNEEMFGFLTEEANKRGIWVIQMFYNIIVSKPFAEKHGLRTQDRSRPIIPIISDYTRKSIAAFIEKYPNVGLLVTLGEAMNTIEDDVEWFTGTIIPGVKDGLNALGRTDEPPIVLRGHDTDAKQVIDEAMKTYSNLYTMFKYNGESLTTYEPRDEWITNHTKLSELGSVHISNVHIMANLEPFRYGSPDFIQRSVVAMHDLQGANGLHLYPQASYWDWPYTADKKEPRLLQIERDWIWYKTWGRYAWNCRRNRDQEIKFWSKELSDFYGCGNNGINILQAYEETGQIAPKLLRRFGISDGNRQTLLLGMFMSQLVNPEKFNVYPSFVSSNGPIGERLIEYVAKEWKGDTHSGETPVSIIAEVVEHGKIAVTAIEKASTKISRNREEFERLKNDVYCYDQFANFFDKKVRAAMMVLRYSHSKDISDLEKAVIFLEKSLEHYSGLVKLTDDKYLYANSMQTQQRKIPISGAEGKNKTWSELNVHYQRELDNFRKNIGLLKTATVPVDTLTSKPVEWLFN